MSFLQFDLYEKLAASLDAAGYENPTPLQKTVMPLINDRKNVIVESQTAAGKTGAYIIPLTSYLLKNSLEEHQGSRILILTSRRERVNQINYTLKRIIKDFNLRIGFISGGRPYQHQMRLLKRPLDVLIATPGRLDDLVKNNKTDFSNLEALVIDDYSIIYHHGLKGLCEKILEQTSPNCPTVAFIQKDDESEKSIKELLPDATIAEVEEEKHPLLSVPQSAYITDDHTHKIAIMDQMMDELEDQSILIYTANNKAASSLEEALANHGHTAVLAHQVDVSDDDKISADAHSAIIISDQINVDVATNTYKNIIHFDLPKKIPVFQNRITNKGWEDLEKPAAILVGPQDRVILKKIEAQAGDSIDQDTIPGLEPMNTYISTPLLSLGGKKGKGMGGQSKRGGKKVAGRRGPNRRKPRTGGNGGGSNNRQKQHKGPYGRLNGGIHRKRSKSGKSSNGQGFNNNQDGAQSNNQNSSHSSNQNTNQNNNRNRNSNSNLNNNPNSNRSNPRSHQGGNPNFRGHLGANRQQSGNTSDFAQEMQKEIAEREAKPKVVIQYKDRRSRRSASAATSKAKDEASED